MTRVRLYLIVATLTVCLMGCGRNTADSTAPAKGPTSGADNTGDNASGDSEIPETGGGGVRPGGEFGSPDPFREASPLTSGGIGGGPQPQAAPTWEGKAVQALGGTAEFVGDLITGSDENAPEGDTSGSALDALRRAIAKGVRESATGDGQATDGQPTDGQ